MDLFVGAIYFHYWTSFKEAPQQKTTRRRNHKKRHPTFSENLHHKSNPSTQFDFEDETCKLSSQDLVVLHS